VRDVNAVLDVLAFEGTEGLSELFSYRIEFTCIDGDIAAEIMLGQNATFSLYGAPHKPPMRRYIPPVTGPLRTLHGVVTGF
ncbi:type VI secretion system tip protein VgrG, partial [Pseudomonas sp. Bout1]|nr:type VI secretion system tip protein VgrG [Pseudomonas sp. Bout1]